MDYIRTKKDEKNFSYIVDQLIDNVSKSLDMSKPVGDVKRSKIKFYLSEVYNLPITRSWYLFGGCVHASRDNYMPPQVYDSNFLKQKQDDFTSEIKKFFSKYKLSTSCTNEFLLSFYKDYAPKPYLEIYKCNTILNQRLTYFLGTLDEYIKEPDDFSKTVSYHDIEEKIIDFKKVFFNEELFSGEHDIVHKYIDFMEDYILALDSIISNSEFVAAETTTLLKDIFSHYSKGVWSLPATKISEKTITGLNRDDEILFEMAKYEQNKNRVNEWIEKFNKVGHKLDIFSTFISIESKKGKDNSAEDIYNIFST